MSYATPADLVARFGEREVIQLTNRDTPRAETVNESVAEGALSDAESEINSYLQGRYALPLAEPPQVLVRLACDMARYNLFGGMGKPNEVADQRYQDAIKFLKAVADGKANLGIAAPQTEAPAESGGPLVAPARSTFNRCTLEDF